MLYQNYINNKTNYLILYQRQLGGKNNTNERFNELFENSYEKFEQKIKNVSKEQRQELWNNLKKKRTEEISKLKKTNSYFTQKQLDDNKISHSFYTHDNGGQPFKITIENGNIIISKNMYDKSDDIKLIELKNYVGIWIGYDATEYEFHGNSVLIKLNDDEYMFVGDTIYKFKTSEEITEYISYIGNNDVPYPIAYSKNFIYHMLNHQYIDKKYINIIPNIKNAEDIVINFYDVDDHKKNFDDVQIIKARDIGNTFLGLWYDAVSKIKQ